MWSPCARLCVLASLLGCGPSTASSDVVLDATRDGATEGDVVANADGDAVGWDADAVSDGDAGSVDDPGRGAWLPPFLADGAPNHGELVVVDQTNPDGAGSVTYVPGCVNFRPQGTAGEGCRHDPFVEAQLPDGGRVRISLGDGRTIAIRYRSAPTAETVSGRHRLTTIIGSTLEPTYATSVSLVAGDFSNPRCASNRSVAVPSVVTGPGADQCQLSANQRYYLNVRSDPATPEATIAIDENPQLR